MDCNKWSNQKDYHIPNDMANDTKLRLKVSTIFRYDRISNHTKDNLRSTYYSKY